MDPDPRKRSEQLDLQVLEDGLLQSHFCKWARESTEKELAGEIEIMLGIRYARKHSWDCKATGALELSGKALKQHAEVVQSYRDSLHSRIDSCLGTDPPDLELCFRLLTRLLAHVQRHLEIQYRDLLMAAAQHDECVVQSAADVWVNSSLGHLMQ